MKTLFLPGMGASHREFPEYAAIFPNFNIVRYKGCITVEDHIQAIDIIIQEWESSGEEYIMIGHSLGANVLYHYISTRELHYLRSATMVGGGPRFFPLNTWRTIFSKPPWFIALVLLFIALGAPFLFLAYGWNGMRQRLDVIDFFKREGISAIRASFNGTLLPLTNNPVPYEGDVPIQLIHLPKDLLLPYEGIVEAKNLIPQLELITIPRSLAHFSHHLDILVVGYITKWLTQNTVISDIKLTYNIEYALEYPSSVRVDLDEDYYLSRKIVIPFLLILILFTIPGFSNWLSNIELVKQLLSIMSLEISYGLRIQDGLIIGTFMIVPTLFLYIKLVTLPQPLNQDSQLSDYPKVSVIVPARNEERNIESCLNSLMDLKYPNYEIIVVDGQSEDRTREIALEMAKNSRVEIKVINEPNLPEGWVGKSWGCHNGVQSANGDWYLFTDADTIHTPSSLKRMMNIVNSEHLDGLSVIGKFKTVTFWERAILPFFKVLLSLLFFGRFSHMTKRVLAIGQYILVRKDLYHLFGGHEAIKGEVAEDIHLATKISSQGEYRAYNGNDIYSVRMYRSLREIQEGLQRNAYESVGSSFIAVIIASMGLLLWRIGPIFLIPFLSRLELSNIALFLLVCYIVFTCLLFIVEMQLNDTKPIWGLIAPIGLIVVLVILLQSSKQHYDNKPRVWKGRVYS